MNFLLTLPLWPDMADLAGNYVPDNVLELNYWVITIIKGKDEN